MRRHIRSYPDRFRARARALRQQGYTYTEIHTRLGKIPQGTLSGWLKDIQLSHEQIQRIHAKIVVSAARGRPLALAAWTRKMQAWRQRIETRAQPFGALPHTVPTIGKLVCGVMYLCEGARYPTSQQLIFGNTDPRIIRTFLTLLRRNHQVDERKFRVRVTHRWDQDGEALKRYWSSVTRIPLGQFYPTYADRRTRGKPTTKLDYRGVCCLHYGDTSLQYELQAIGEAILKANNGADGDRTRDLVNAIDALSQAELLPRNSGSHDETVP